VVKRKYFTSLTGLKPKDLSDNFSDGLFKFPSEDSNEAASTTE
jgi:hypothetical protein